MPLRNICTNWERHEFIREHFNFGAYSYILGATIFCIVPGSIKSCSDHSTGRPQTKFSGVFHLLGENKIRWTMKFSELFLNFLFLSFRSIGSWVISWEFLKLKTPLFCNINRITTWARVLRLVSMISAVGLVPLLFMYNLASSFIQSSFCLQ